MESKNIKIVDEHGIDRVANIVCSIDVDGSDYVVYWIERDNDNDNLFVSKLLKNNDGTSTMMNIEDSLEKGNLSEIVKELVTYAINDENGSISTGTVTLKNGKNVKISNVLFNKEQNINVQKTYITTVKKSVTKVSEGYYHIEKTPEVVVESVPTKEEIVENVDSLPEVKPIEVPSINEVQTEPVVPSSPILEVPVQESQVVTPVLEVPSDIVAPEAEAINLETSVPEVTVPSEPQPTMVVPQEPQPAIPETKVEAVMSVVGNNQLPVSNPAATFVAEPPISQEPVAPVAPPVMSEVSQPVAPPVNNVPNELFFDGSKETNLAGVFNGNSDNSQPVVAAQSVAPIREFGQDEPVIPIVNDVAPVVAAQPNPTNASQGGFANNKFFIVIAIALFMASCVFLGYEVFRFFQMK